MPTVKELIAAEHARPGGWDPKESWWRVQRQMTPEQHEAEREKTQRSWPASIRDVPGKAVAQAVARSLDQLEQLGAQVDPDNIDRDLTPAEQAARARRRAHERGIARGRE